MENVNAPPDPDPDAPHLPPWLSAPELMAAELGPRRPILDPILATQSLALLHGPRGLGKTFVALGIAWAAASGGSFLGWRAPRPHRVCYVDGEMAAVDMQQRLRAMGPVPPTLGFLLADLNPRGGGLPDLGTGEGQHLLHRQWGEQPELLVIDNLASLVGTARGGGGWGAMQDYLMHLRRHGLAVLMVHHANKSGRQRGTSRHEDMLDLVLALRRPDGYRPRDGARFEIHFDKARGLRGDAVEPIEARLQTDAAGLARWSWQPARTGELARVAALLKDGLNPNQVARALGISKSKSYRLREKAATRLADNDQA